jgi:CheY-like chemotaxis protein
MLTDLFNCSIDEARDGVEAMAMILNDNYSLVLMDLDMPRMTGFECTSLIREREQSTGIRLPVICMTTARSSETKNDCLKAGMDDYIDKDCTTEQFEHTVRQWLFRTPEG